MFLFFSLFLSDASNFRVERNETYKKKDIFYPARLHREDDLRDEFALFLAASQCIYRADSPASAESQLGFISEDPFRF